MSVSKQLTIACVAADLIPGQLGGAEHHVVEVTKRLSAKHKIFLFVGPNPAIKSQFNRNVTTVPIKYPKIPNLYGISYIIFGYFQLHHHLKHMPLDLLWAKQSFPQAPLAALLKLTHHKPLYITAQNPLLHQEELIIKGSLLKPFHSLLALLIHPLISFAYKRSDLVAAVSHYSAKLAKQLGATKVIVIPNGINLPKKTRLKKPSLKAPFTIISVSALIPRNGLDTLITATALLPKELNWRLIIAGDGPIKSQLKSQISNLYLTKRIKLLGQVSNQKIPKLLAQAQIFVRPSRKEGFGVAFIEAMAEGVPVIGTNIGGIPDFLTHKKTGLTAKVNNPHSVADNIMLIYRDKKLYRQLQQNAKKLAKNHYTWDIISRQVESQFANLVKHDSQTTN